MLWLSSMRWSSVNCSISPSIFCGPYSLCSGSTSPVCRNKAIWRQTVHSETQTRELSYVGNGEVLGQVDPDNPSSQINGVWIRHVKLLPASGLKKILVLLCACVKWGLTMNLKFPVTNMPRYLFRGGNRRQTRLLYSLLFHLISIYTTMDDIHWMSWGWSRVVKDWSEW